MNGLSLLLPCPLLIFALAAWLRSPQLVSRLSAVLISIQLALALVACGPHLGVSDASPLLLQGFRLDQTSAFFLILTTMVVAAGLLHAVPFFDAELASPHPPTPWDVSQVYLFVSVFLLSMYGVVAADDLGILWICLEASTLLSAPLVYYHRSRTSLEATWKYLIVCSVGIAFAFFGTSILYAASQKAEVLGVGTLSIHALTLHARELPVSLLRFGFVFTLLGYATKAGLFPLHNWLPDAHSEAPAPISAILSGALLNCALVAIWRVVGLMNAAGQASFVHATLLPMGAITVLVATLFLLRQQDLKRLWAYSSMENVGLMACAIAVGSAGGFGLQALNHSLAKVALFLLAGNILQEQGTKRLRQIHGLLVSRPLQACVLLAATFAVAGSPPFGAFLSEWLILQAVVDRRMLLVIAVLLAALAIGFIALSIRVGGMLLGPPSERAGDHGPLPERPLAFHLVPVILILVSLFLGLALPAGVVAMAGGRP